MFVKTIKIKKKKKKKVSRLYCAGNCWLQFIGVCSKLTHETSIRLGLRDMYYVFYRLLSTTNFRKLVNQLQTTNLKPLFQCFKGTILGCTVEFKEASHLCSAYADFRGPFKRFFLHGVIFLVGDHLSRVFGKQQLQQLDGCRERRQVIWTGYSIPA